MFCVKSNDFLNKLPKFLNQFETTSTVETIANFSFSGNKLNRLTISLNAPLFDVAFQFNVIIFDYTPKQFNLPLLSLGGLLRVITYDSLLFFFINDDGKIGVRTRKINSLAQSEISNLVKRYRASKKDFVRLPLLNSYKAVRKSYLIPSDNLVTYGYVMFGDLFTSLSKVLSVKHDPITTYIAIRFTGSDFFIYLIEKTSVLFSVSIELSGYKGKETYYHVDIDFIRRFFEMRRILKIETASCNVSFGFSDKFYSLGIRSSIRGQSMISLNSTCHNLDYYKFSEYIPEGMLLFNSFMISKKILSKLFCIYSKICGCIEVILMKDGVTFRSGFDAAELVESPLIGVDYIFPLTKQVSFVLDLCCLTKIISNITLPAVNLTFYDSCITINGVFVYEKKTPRINPTYFVQL